MFVNTVLLTPLVIVVTIAQVTTWKRPLLRKRGQYAASQMICVALDALDPQHRQLYVW